MVDALGMADPAAFAAIRTPPRREFCAAAHIIVFAISRITEINGSYTGDFLRNIMNNKLKKTA